MKIEKKIEENYDSDITAQESENKLNKKIPGYSPTSAPEHFKNTTESAESRNMVIMSETEKTKVLIKTMEGSTSAPATTTKTRYFNENTAVTKHQFALDSFTNVTHKIVPTSYCMFNCDQYCIEKYTFGDDHDYSCACTLGFELGEDLIGCEQEGFTEILTSGRK